MKAYYYIGKLYRNKPFYTIWRRLADENGDKCFKKLPMNYESLDDALEVSTLLNAMEVKEVHE